MYRSRWKRVVSEYPSAYSRSSGLHAWALCGVGPLAPKGVRLLHTHNPNGRTLGKGPPQDTYLLCMQSMYLQSCMQSTSAPQPTPINGPNHSPTKPTDIPSAAAGQLLNAQALRGLARWALARKGTFRCHPRSQETTLTAQTGA